MARSLFFAIFLRIVLLLAAVTGLGMAVPELRGIPLFAIGVLFAVGVSFWVVRPICRTVAQFERFATRLLPPHGGELDRPAFREFDGLARVLRTASEEGGDALRVSAESRSNLEGLLDSMQDAVVAVDATGRILWSNQRMQRLMLQGGAGAAVSSPVRVGHALVQTVRDPDVLQAVQTALEAGSVSQLRANNVLAGSTFEVNASPMPGGGAVAVLHDVTRIEQVERTQQDFIANVSHELRTPLTSITGYVETLLDHEKTLSVNARLFLETILKNATRMNRLTEDLLVMARVESAEQAMHPSPQRADMLVRDAVESMSGLVQENEAVLELGEMTPRQVYADHDATLQVLGNLIENAIKYGQAKNALRSRVIVSARELSEPHEAVEFSVRDFGQGIASEHLSRIFERFYRVDKARSRDSGGTGLGLAIARHMVQTQGGTIRAESELNGGSTFLFTLPVAQYPIA